jgi:superfamily II DNA/RNA helicase
VDTFSITLQVHVFVGGVEEKLMANKAIKQAVEVMMNPGGKMSRVQEILRRALDSSLQSPHHTCQHSVADQCLRFVPKLDHRLACVSASLSSSWAASMTTCHIAVAMQTPSHYHVCRSFPRGTRILIFCSTKRMCDQLAWNLNREFGASAIHGDKKQQERDFVLAAFKVCELDPGPWFCNADANCMVCLPLLVLASLLCL